jgi:hypothetical protein
MDIEKRNCDFIETFKGLDLDRNISRYESDTKKAKAIEWVETKFPSCPIRDELLVYLRYKAIVLRCGYYRQRKNWVMFYFKVFDRETKTSKLKKIGLVPLADTRLVKRGFVNHLFGFY